MRKMTFFLLLTVALVGTTACGGEEKPAEPAPSGSNNLLNNLVEQGMNKAVQEVTTQLADTSSSLNSMMDTVKTVLEDNQDEIEAAVTQGLNALNKSH